MFFLVRPWGVWVIGRTGHAPHASPLSGTPGSGRRTFWCVGLLALSLGAAPDSAKAQAGEFTWNVSASEAAIVTATPPFTGEATLYLWLGCAVRLAEQVTLDVSGSLEILEFVPRSNVTNSGDAHHLALTFAPCVPLFTVVGEFVVRDSTGAGGRLCLSGGPVGVDCWQNTWEIATEGFASDGDDACIVNVCALVSVDDASWGETKALYQDGPRR